MKALPVAVPALPIIHRHVELCIIEERWRLTGHKPITVAGDAAIRLEDFQAEHPGLAECLKPRGVG